MTIPAKSIIQRIVRDLNDETSIRWTVPDLVRYFNDGQREIATLRPDSMSTRITHSLVAGAKQSIPANGTKLIDINSNAAGNKGAVTKVSDALLSTQVRGWRNLPGTNEILHYIYDDREPKTFEVFPPALSTAALDLEYSALPGDIPEPADGVTFAAVTGNFAMGALFANALQHYILFRCYSKDTEYTANPELAQAYQQRYANDLGIEIKATSAFGPTQAKQSAIANAVQGA